VTLARDILDSNANIEDGEAAILMAGYAYADAAIQLAGGHAPLLEMLIDEDVLAEGCRLYRWDVPRACRVILPRGRDGALLTEASAARVLPRRARQLAFPALEALTREGLAEPVLEDAARPVVLPVKRPAAVKKAVRCDFCGHEHHCQPAQPAGSRWQKREYLLDQLRQIIPDAIASTGEIPSSRSVARLLGRADDRSIRSGWDLLTRRGDLPSRFAASADGWLEVPQLEVPQVLAGFKLTWAGKQLADQVGQLHETSAFAPYAAGSALN
jgi:hypothetical protein